MPVGANERRPPWPDPQACWTPFDPSFPVEYVRRLRVAADDLSTFLTLPPDADLLNRWAALLPWLEARLCDHLPAFVDVVQGRTPYECDVAEVFVKAYSRWAERRGFACRMIHEAPHRTHFTLLVQGPFAF